MSNGIILNKNSKTAQYQGSEHFLSEKFRAMNQKNCTKIMKKSTDIVTQNVCEGGGMTAIFVPI